MVNSMTKNEEQIRRCVEAFWKGVVVMDMSKPPKIDIGYIAPYTSPSPDDTFFMRVKYE